MMASKKKPGGLSGRGICPVYHWSSSGQTFRRTVKICPKYLCHRARYALLLTHRQAITQAETDNR